MARITRWNGSLVRLGQTQRKKSQPLWNINPASSLLWKVITDQRSRNKAITENVWIQLLLNDNTSHYIHVEYKRVIQLCVQDIQEFGRSENAHFTLNALNNHLTGWLNCLLFTKDWAFHLATLTFWIGCSEVSCKWFVIVISLFLTSLPWYLL